MILITGSTGFIGRSLTRALTSAQRNIRPFNGYINDPNALASQLEGVDTILHLAGGEASGRQGRVKRVDYFGTRALIDACDPDKIKQFILLSRLNANPDLRQPLLQMKGEAEKMVRNSGLPFTIIRSASVYGRDDRFFNTIMGLAAWSWPFVWLPAKGGVSLQPIWVEDLVRCLISTIGNEKMLNRTIEIAGEERLQYHEMVELLMESADLNRRPFHPRINVVRPLAYLMFSWWRFPPVNRFFINRFSIPEVAPIDSVSYNFGFRPKPMRGNLTYLRGRNHRAELIKNI